MFGNAYSKFGAGADNKSLTGPDDAPDLNADTTLNVDGLEVSGDAQVDGRLNVNQLAPQSLGPYIQNGPVDFNSSSLSNANIVSGKLNNVTVTNSRGYFTYLNSGKPNSGYEVKFYGSANGNIFDWNGLKNYLYIKSNVVLDLPKPAHLDSEFQIAPEKPNSLNGALVTSIEGNIATGSFSGVNINPGDYLALQDGTQYKISAIDPSGTALTLDNTNVDRPGLKLTYTVHNAGWYYDNKGDLIAEGYGYLQLPKMDPFNNFTYSTNVGMLRYNQTSQSFEGYGKDGWVPLALNGYVTDKSFMTGMIVEPDPGANGLDRIRFFDNKSDTLTINSNGQVSVGTANNPPDDSKFYVLGNSRVDGTATDSQLIVSNWASISGSLTIGSDISAGGDFSLTGSGQIGGSLTIQSSASVSGPLYVGSDANITGSLTLGLDLSARNATLSSNLFVGSSATIAGSLSVFQDFFAGGAGSFAGGLNVASNTSLLGSLSVSNNAYFRQSASISSGLYVGSSSTIAGSLTVQKDLSVVQSGNFGARLFVGSDTSIGGSLTVANGITTGSFASVSGNLSATGNEFLGGSLSVSKDIYGSGSATISGGLSVSSNTSIAGTLTTLGDSSTGGSSSITGGLYVGQNATFSGTVTFNTRAIFNGSEDFYGDIHVHGNIISDGTITSAAQAVSGYSSLTGPVYIGSSTQILGSLSVGQSLTVGQGASISGSLYAGGNSTLAGSLTLLKSLLVNSAGSFGGSLTVAASGSFGSSLQVGKDIQVAGSETISGGLAVGSNSSFAGSVSVLKDLRVFGSETISSGLFVGSSATIGGSLTVDQALNVLQAASLLGNVYLGSNLGVNGSVTIRDDLTVSKSATVLGPLSVGSGANFGGTVSIAQDLLVSGGATITGSSRFMSNLSVDGNTTLSGTLSASGPANFGSNIYISGSATISAGLTAGSDVNFLRSMTVSGNAYVGSSLLVSNDINATRNLYVSGSSSVTGNLSVGSSATFLGSVTVRQDLYTGGSASITGSVAVGTDLVVTGTSRLSTLIVSKSESVTGGLFVGSAATFNSQVVLNKDLAVLGNSSLAGSLSVYGNEVVQGSVTVNKDLLVSGTGSFVNISSSGTVNANLIKATNTAISNTLTVGSWANFLGSATVQRDFIAASNATVAGYLSVGSFASFLGSVNVAQDLSVAQSASVTGNLTTSSNLAVFGDASLTGGLQVGQSASITGGVYVGSSSTFAGSLTVQKGLTVFGAATFSSYLSASGVYATFGSFLNGVSTATLTATVASITGKATIGSLSVLSYGSFAGAVAAGNVSAQTVSAKALTVANSANISGSLTVNGSVTFNNNLFVNGTITALASNFIYGGGGSGGTGSSGGTVIIMNSSGGATIAGTALTIEDYGSIGGALLAGSDVTVLGSLSVGSDLYVSGTINASALVLSGGLSLTGPVYIGSDLTIAGSQTVNQSLVVGQDAQIRGSLTVASGLSVNLYESLTGYLWVGSSATFAGSVNVLQLLTAAAGASVVGSLSVAGNELVSGTLTVNKSLYVSGASSLSGPIYAGSSLLISKDLNVGQNATISGNLVVNSFSAFAGSVSVAKDITAGGSGTYLGGLFVGLDQIVAGSLTVNRDLAVGQSATISSGLYVGSNVVFAGSLSVSKDAAFGASATISGAIYVGSSATIAGSLTVGQDLLVSQTATVLGNLYVASDSFLKGSLSVSNSIFVGQSGTILGGLFIGSNLGISGSLSVGDDLVVSQTSSILGNQWIGSNQYVIGSSSIAKSLTVAGISSLSAGLYVGSFASTTGYLSSTGLVVTGPGSVSGSFSVGGNESVGGSLSVSRALAVTGPATITGNLFVGSSQFVSGSTTIQRDLQVGRSATVLGGLLVGSSATIAGSLTVGQDFYVNDSATISGNVYIGSSTTIAGSLSVAQDFYAGGSGTVTGGLSVGSDLSTAGSLSVAADLFANGSGTFLGNLFVGSSTSISGSLTVDQSLYAKSDATIAGVLTTGSDASFGGSVSVLDDLTVGSNITAGGTLTSLAITAGTASVTNLTASTASISGAVTLGSTLSLTSTAYLGGNLSVTSNTSIYGTLSVSKDLFLSGSETISGGLKVGSNATFSGSVTVNKGLTVAGAATFSSNVSILGYSVVSGSQTVLKDLSVGGSEALTGSLNVGNYATFAAGVGIGGELFARQSGTILGGLFVGSSATIAGSLSVQSDLTVAGSETLSGNLAVGSDLSAAGSLSANYLAVSTSGILGGSLTVGSGASFGGTITAAGLSIANSEYLGGSLTVGSSANILGSLTVSKDIVSAGNGSFAGNLAIAGNESISGSLSVQKTLAVTQNGSFGGSLNVGQNAVVSSSVTAGSAVTAPYGSFSNMNVGTIGGNVFFNGTVTALAFSGSGLTTGGTGGTVGSITVSTITGSALQIAYYGSIGSSLVVGTSIITSSLSASWGSFSTLILGSNVVLSGSIVAKIGAPTGQTNYGSYNFASLTSSDSISDAFNKIDNSLRILNTELTNYVQVQGTILTVGSVLSTGTVLGSNLGIYGNGNVTGTLSSGPLQVSGDSSVSGNQFTGGTTSTGALAVSGDSSVSGNEHISGNLSVDGTITFNGPIKFNGSFSGGTGYWDNLQIGSVLSVAGSASISGDLSTAGKLSGSQLAITDYASITGNLSSLGTVSAPNGSFTQSIYSGTVASTSLFVTSNGSFGGSLTLAGNLAAASASLSSYLYSASSVTAQSMYAQTGSYSQNLQIGGLLTGSSVSLNGNLSSAGSITSNVIAANSGSFVKNLYIGQTVTTSILNAANVTATGTLSSQNIYGSAASISGSLTVGQAILSTYGSFAGDVNTGGSLSVTGNIAASGASLTGDLTVGGTFTGDSASLTSLTLSSLTTDSAVVTGSFTVNDFSASSASISNNLYAGSLSATSVYGTLASFSALYGGSITGQSASFMGNVTSQSTISGNVLKGNTATLSGSLYVGSSITAITASISGSVQSGTVSSTYGTFVKTVMSTITSTVAVISTATISTLSTIQLTGSTSTFSGSVYSKSSYAQTGSYTQSLFTNQFAAINGTVTNSLYVGQSLYASYASLTGDLFASGNVTGDVITGNSATFTGVINSGGLASTGDIYTTGSITGSVLNIATASISDTLQAGFATVSSLSAGPTSVTTLYATDSVTASGALTAYSGSFTSDLFVGGSLTSNNFAAINAQYSGTVSAGQLAANNVLSTNLQIYGYADLATISAGQAYVIGSVVARGFVGTYASLSGTILTQGASVTGTIYGQYGSFAGNLSGRNLQLSDTLQSSTVSGNALVVNSYASLGGNLSAASASLSGDLRSQGTVTGIYGSFNSLYLTSDLSAANINTQHVAADSLAVNTYGSFGGDLASAGTVSGVYGSFAGNLYVAGQSDLGTVTTTSFSSAFASITNVTTSSISTTYVSSIFASISSLTVATGSLSNNLYVAGTLVANSASLSGILQTSTVTSAAVVTNIATVGSILTTPLASVNSLMANYATVTGNIAVGSSLYAQSAYVTGTVVTSQVLAQQISAGSSLSAPTANIGTLTVLTGTVTGDLKIGSTLYSQNSSVSGTVLASQIISQVVSVSSYLTTPTGSIGTLVSATGSVTGDFTVGSTLYADTASVSGTLTTSTVIATSASISGLVQAGSFSTDALSVSTLSGDAIITKTASITTSAYIATLTSNYGSVSGDLYVAGTLSGLIGLPGTLTSYDPKNPAGLLPTDTFAQALQKLDAQLLKAATNVPPPDPNECGQYLHDVRGYTIYLDVDVDVIACLAGTTATISNLVTDVRVKTKLTTPLYDGVEGVLTSMLTIGTLDSIDKGSIDLSTVEYGVEVNQGYLHVSNKSQFYLSDVSTQNLNGNWVGFEAQIIPDEDLPRGVQLRYRLQDTKTGNSNTVGFQVDDSQTPVFDNPPSFVCEDTHIRCISGIYSYATGDACSVSSSLSNVVSSCYNYYHGLCVATSNVFGKQEEKNRVGRDVTGYVPDSSQTILLNASILDNVYSEEVDIEVTAYNAVGGTNVAIIHSSCRVDTVSVIAGNQVTSGTGIFPTAFGNPYDHTVSLLTVPELQLLCGRYRVPVVKDYRAALPPGSPDYTTCRNTPYRYSTFRYDLHDCVSHCYILFDKIAGANWGSGGVLAINMTLQVRLIDTLNEADTGWLDANQFYEGGCVPQGDGSPCLLCTDTTSDCKHITFGMQRRGALYVRIGFEAVTDSDNKSFKKISVETARVCRPKDMASQLLRISDPLFTAFVSQSKTLVTNLSVNMPGWDTIYNFFDAGNGVLTAVLCHDGDCITIGSVDLQAVGDKNVTNGCLTVSDKHDIFNGDPHKEGLYFAGNASVHFPVSLAASSVQYTLQLQHSITGNTNVVNFSLDSPLLPVFKEQPHVVITGGTRCLSGLSVLTAHSNVSVSIKAANVISYFYNYVFGIAALTGTHIRPATDAERADLDVTMYTPFTDQSVTLTTTFADKCAARQSNFNVALYNCIGDTVSVSENVSLVLDSKSQEHPNRVSSGVGSNPDKIGIDFGKALDHTESLLNNSELQLFDGVYSLPLAIDYTSFVPAGPDYSTVLMSIPWRFATFKFSGDYSATTVLIIQNISGEGWGSGCTLAEDMSLQIRCLSGVCELDTGWMDGNSFFEFGPAVSGAPCLSSAGTTYNRKHLYLPCCDTVYVRIGFACGSDMAKSFSNMCLVCPRKSRCKDDEEIRLTGDFFSAVKSSTGRVTQGLTSDSINATYGFESSGDNLTCKVYTKESDCKYAAISTDNFDLGSIGENDARQSGHFSVSTLCRLSYPNQHYEVHAQVPYTLPDKSYKLKYSYRKHGVTREVTSPIYTFEPVYIPVYVIDPQFSFTGDVKWISGVSTPSANSTLQVVATVGNAVLDYYCTKGVMSCRGECFTEVYDDERNIRPANSDYTVTLKPKFLNYAYRERVEVAVTLYAVDGTKYTQSFTQLTPLSGPLRCDTVSQPNTCQVTSGTGRFPLTGFGLPYDHTLSILNSCELQLLNGRFQLPPITDYSVSFPSGSPDYRNALSTCPVRYATFQFEVACASLVNINVCGCDGGLVASQHGFTSGCSLDIKVADHTGWLNALTYVDPTSVSIRDGEGCLLNSRVCSDCVNLSLTLGNAYSGIIYVRIGIVCDVTNLGKRFTSVRLQDTNVVSCLTLAVPQYSGIQIETLVNVDNLTFSTPHTKPLYIKLSPQDLTLKGTVRKLEHCCAAEHGQIVAEQSIICSSIQPGSSLQAGFLQVSRNYGELAHTCHDDTLSQIVVGSLVPSFNLPPDTCYRYVVSSANTSESVCFRLANVPPRLAFLLPSEIILPSGQHKVSGVATFDSQTVVQCLIHQSPAGEYISRLRGLGSFSGTGISIVYEADQRQIDFRNVRSDTSLVYTLSSCFNNDVYSENCEFVVSIFNVRDECVTDRITLVGANAVRIDTVSIGKKEQVKSGGVAHPKIPHVDFGQTYDHNENLLSNIELQLVGGQYMLPRPVDYTKVLPAGSPDYTTAIDTNPKRFATFVFNINCCSNLILCLGGCGGGLLTATGTLLSTVSLEIMIASEIIATGWLDATKYFDIENSIPENEGDGVLLSVADGNFDVARYEVSLGRQISGDLYVRIGFPSIRENLSLFFRDVYIFTQPQWDGKFDLSAKKLRGVLVGQVNGERYHNDLVVDNPPETFPCLLQADFNKSVIRSAVCLGDTVLSTASCWLSTTEPYKPVAKDELTVTRLASRTCLTARKCFADGKLVGLASCIIKATAPLQVDESYSYKLTLDDKACNSQQTNFTLISSGPNLSFVNGPTIEFTTSTRMISGVTTYCSGSIILCLCTASGVVSKYINDDVGMMSLRGDCIEGVTEKASRTVDVSTISPNSSVDLQLYSTFLNHTYSERCHFTVTLYDVAGNELQSIITGVNNSPVRVDTISVTPTNQVTSSGDIYPNLYGADFGLPYDHATSLLDNHDLQLIDGKYRLPYQIDFSSSLPAGSPDYSAVLTTSAIRWSTFEYSLHCCASFCVGLNGCGGGMLDARGNLTQAVLLYIRVVQDDNSGTGWLNVKKRFDGGIPVSDGDPCLVSVDGNVNDANYAISLGCQRSGKIFVRIGIFSDIANATLYFQELTVSSPEREQEIFTLEDPFYTATVVGRSRDHEVLVYNRRPASTVVLVQSACCSDACSGYVEARVKDLTHDKTLFLDKLHLKQAVSGTVTAGSLTLKSASTLSCGKDRRRVVAGTQVPVDLEVDTLYEYKLRSDKLDASIRFFVAKPNTLFQFVGEPIVSVTHESTHRVSGIMTYDNATKFVCMVTCVLGYYVNDNVGLGSFTGTGISDATETSQRIINLDTAVPNSVVTFPLTSTLISSFYTEEVEFTTAIFDAAGNKITKRITRVDNKPVRLDGVSSFASNRVTSGTTRYPDNALHDFGLPYSHDELLTQNQELQLVDGRYKLPAPVDYSGFLPIGSPDYTTVLDTVDRRYATFTFDIRCKSSVEVCITGCAGGLTDFQGKLNPAVTLDLLVSEDTGSTGWLDATSATDVVNVGTTNGTGILCSYHGDTTRTTYSVLLGRDWQGTCYVRLGIAASLHNIAMSFTDIDIFDCVGHSAYEPVYQ